MASIAKVIELNMKYIDNFRSETQRMQQNARALAFQRITAISKYNPAPTKAARG